jgi:hypothetical protein
VEQTKKVLQQAKRAHPDRVAKNKERGENAKEEREKKRAKREHYVSMHKTKDEK